MITVTRPWLPDRKKLDKYIDEMYVSQQLTNGGPLLDNLTARLKQHLDVKHIILVNNGTSALQVALKALSISGEVITSPFSFIATSSAIQWLGLQPVFADIDPRTFNLEPKNVEKCITDNTTAILATHVFGNPCEHDALRALADKYNLKLLYDAAHCFGVKQNDSSVLNYGDISVLSFHATKLFHTMEGGAIITNSDDMAKKIKLMINFGIENKDTISLCGINAKLNEMSAAMGLAVLDDIDIITGRRELIAKRYYKALQGVVGLQCIKKNVLHNHSYLPIVLKSEFEVNTLINIFEKKKVIPRRYFYPSLDTLSFLKSRNTCPKSRSLSSRVLCIPIYPTMELNDQSFIIDIIINTLSSIRSNEKIRSS